MPERREGRDLAEEVAEAGAVRVEGLEAVEVDHPAQLGQGSDDEDQDGRTERWPRVLSRGGGRRLVAGELRQSSTAAAPDPPPDTTRRASADCPDDAIAASQIRPGKL